MAIDIGQYFNLGSDKAGNITEYKDPGGLFTILSVVLRNIYVIAAIILFIFILVGGAGMILNAGNVEKQKQSSKTLGSAVAGFLILFLSYWIIKLVQLITGIQII